MRPLTLSSMRPSWGAASAAAGTTEAATVDAAADHDTEEREAKDVLNMALAVARGGKEPGRMEARGEPMEA